MTGNLVYLAFALGAGHLPVLPPVVALLAYVAGVAVGSRLVVPGVVGDRRLGFALEWALLAVAVVLAAALHPTNTSASRYAVVSVLALAMGIQNAMLRRWGVRDLATNVMTLTLVNLVAESPLGSGTGRPWRRRLSSIVLFVASATVGALLQRAGVVWPLLAALAVCGAAQPVLLHPGARPPD